MHTHKLVVILYLLQLIIKAVLLLTDKKEALEKVTAKTRIAHIVLSVLMLVTGVYLMFRSPMATQPFMFVKLALVLASIPLGIVGFKKSNKALALLAVLAMGGAMALAFLKPSFASTSPQPEPAPPGTTLQPPTTDQPAKGPDAGKGKQAFATYGCVTCHGEDGAAGFQGAKNLAETAMTDDELTAIIRNGKNLMPANPALGDDDVKNIIAYIRSLKH